MKPAEDYRRLMLELVQAGVPARLDIWHRVVGYAMARYQADPDPEGPDAAVLAAQLRILDLEAQVARFVEAGCEQILANGDALEAEHLAEENERIQAELRVAERRNRLKLV